MTTKPNLYTFTGDGAFAYVHDHAVLPFLQKTAGDLVNLAVADWSLPNRVRTDGKAIMDGVNAALADKAAAVKYPGATARQDELDFVCAQIGSAQPTTPLGKGKSPNAPVRGIAGFDASIIRTPTASAALVKPLETEWKPSTPVTIQALDTGGRAANMRAFCAGKEGMTLQVCFVDADGKETLLKGANGSDFVLQKDSTLSTTYVEQVDVEKTIRDTYARAIATGADIYFTNKNTVLTSVDAPIAKLEEKIFNEEFKAQFEAKGLKRYTGLVDDAFAYLMANCSAPERPMIMLCPDDLYGKQIQSVLEQVKQHGLHYKHTEHAIAVGRLSNGYGDEYGGVHYTPEKTGSLIIKSKDGTVLKEITVQPQQMWLMACSSSAAAKDYTRRMIDAALQDKICGRAVKYLYFGFDEKSLTEGPLINCIREVIESRRAEIEQAGLIVEIGDPALVAAKMLTHPPKEGVILALNNLWGDIIADAFPALANNKASYDSLLLSDKGFLVETGAGGTAPDLLFGKPGKPYGLIHTGRMKLNPVAILTSYAEAFRYTGKTQNNAALVTYAEQLHEAITLTMKQGYITGDLMRGDKHQLREEAIDAGVTPRPVDTRVFVKAVEANLLSLQGRKAEAETSRSELTALAQKLDLTSQQSLEGAELKAVLQYATENAIADNSKSAA